MCDRQTVRNCRGALASPDRFREKAKDQRRPHQRILTDGNHSEIGRSTTARRMSASSRVEPVAVCLSGHRLGSATRRRSEVGSAQQTVIRFKCSNAASALADIRVFASLRRLRGAFRTSTPRLALESAVSQISSKGSVLEEDRSGDSTAAH